MLRKEWLLCIALVILVSITVACGNNSESAMDNNSALNEEESIEENGENGESAEGNNGSGQEEEAEEEIGGDVQQPEMPKPDLEGIPEVVVEVNGGEITREEFITAYEGQFQLAVMQSQMMGQELDQDQLKAQIAESMVGTELLMQEADNRNYNASEESIDQTLEEIVEQNGMASKDEFLAAIEQQQGMDEETVRSELAKQVKINLLIEDEAGDINPTEEELQVAYDQIVAQQQGGDNEVEMPSFEEMKPNLQEQIMMQKEQEAIIALISQLRENADITFHL